MAWTDERITAERLREVVTYSEVTGEFFTKIPRQGIRPKQPLGHVDKNGYRRIMVEGHRHLAHRLAWLYVHGTFPPGNLDHINGDQDDNRIANLRQATRSQNSANTRPKNPTGLKGAHYNRFRNYWQSYIRIGGKSRFLGRFDTPEQAHAAYMQAARDIHGDFVRGTL